MWSRSITAKYGKSDCWCTNGVSSSHGHGLRRYIRSLLPKFQILITSLKVLDGQKLGSGGYMVGRSLDWRL